MNSFCLFTYSHVNDQAGEAAASGSGNVIASDLNGQTFFEFYSHPKHLLGK